MISSYWQFWAILSALLAATTAITAKVGLRGTDPNVAQLVRTTVVFVSVALLSAHTGRWREASGFSTTTWIVLILSGLATAGSWLCYFQALAIGSASRVAAVDKLSVPLVAVISVLVLNERLDAWGWLGVALVTAGVVFISMGK